MSLQSLAAKVSACKIRFEPAEGVLQIHGGSGHDNLRLHAGEMTIGVADASDYAQAEAGVKIGDLNAPAFGVSKSGFFRSFKTTNPNGRYTLRAGVGTGEINLADSK